MTDRVAAFSFARRAIHFSAHHSSNILKYQDQISSGLQFQRPSDEPISFRQVTSLKTRYTELSADRVAVNLATSVLSASVTQVESMIGVVNRAKTLTQQAIQASDDDERKAIALEVEGLLQQMKDIALTHFNDKFLFGGTDSESPPFAFSEVSRLTGEIRAEYNGSTTRSRASVGDSISVDTYYTGAEVFRGGGRQPTVVVGQTGARPGSGTDTGVGRLSLTVTHTQTTFAGNSGIQPGISSPGGDTIIGPQGAHKLTIVDTSGDGSRGTISLNGTPPVEFTSSDTDLQIQTAAGLVVHVDTTNIVAGFNGTIDLTADGTLSVDGGVTTQPVDFVDNQILVHSETDEATTIDSENIRRAGKDRLEYPGTANAFEVLAELVADLRNHDGLDTRDLSQSLDRRLGELTGIAENTFEILGEQSTSLRTLDALGHRIDDLTLSVETEISELQATDLPSAVLRLENSQALLQYTYAVTAELTSIGLLQFLQ